MLSATSPQPQPLKPEMMLSSQSEVSSKGLITGHVKPAPSSSSNRSSRSHERSSSSNSSNTSSSRPAPSPRDLPEPAPAPRPPSDPLAARTAQRPPEPAAMHHGFEEGADLPFQRRTLNVRIDRENPYQ
jgi:hypothetical protein